MRDDQLHEPTSTCIDGRLLVFWRTDIWRKSLFWYVFVRVDVLEEPTNAAIGDVVAILKILSPLSRGVGGVLGRAVTRSNRWS